MSTLHTLALEYVVAIYPLVLTVVIYLCIQMHDRGVRLMVCVWRPFHVCFARFRRKWDPKGSVIHAFATFLLLSYSKLLTVSYSLLGATELYNNEVKELVQLYYTIMLQLSISADNTFHLLCSQYVSCWCLFFSHCYFFSCTP